MNAKYKPISFLQFCLFIITMAFISNNICIAIFTNTKELIYAIIFGLIILTILNNLIFVVVFFKRLDCFFNGHHEYVEIEKTMSMQCKRCGKKDYTPDYWNVKY